ncbi:MAG: OsmC family protein [Pedobacter sp.]|nr:OsmC family protein [Pedobacter sp.]
MKAIASASVVSGNENYRHDISTGRHTLVADEPEHAGGRDAGPAPYDYILSGLGACTAITLRMYAERKGWNIGQIKVELEFFKNKEGESRIERRLSSDAALTDEQWGRLLEISEKTPVTLTLKTGTPIATSKT